LVILGTLGFLNFRVKKKKEQAELSRQVSENDMKALRAQMNPHFVFNWVQTVLGLLDNQKTSEIKACLEKFSYLTRSILENSEKKEIPLVAELETLKLYMELENMRFKIPFTSEILIDHMIDPITTMIPPLILQPLIENSIKHGFNELNKAGHIKIEVKQENEKLVCLIEDNGVGRQKTQLKPPVHFKKESKGMKIIEERLRLISEIKKTKSFYLIDDLKDSSNNPAGTRVKMFLPYELSV